MSPARGRLRYADRLRRPRWRYRQLSTNFHLDHLMQAGQCRELIVQIVPDQQKFQYRWRRINGKIIFISAASCQPAPPGA
jgi:hypothetical protein